MIVHPPEIVRDGADVCLSARIETEARPQAVWPERLWFRVPADREPLLSARADAFAAALFILAMRRRETLELHGPTSPRLLYGLEAYQRILAVYFPTTLTPVSIHARTIAPAPTPAPGAGRVMSAFSGGLDSFYTLWAHRPERVVVPDAAVTTALFVHGLDIPLADTRTYETCRESYAPLLAGLGVDLVPLRTNVRAFLDEVYWHRMFGAVLIASALAAGNGTRRFYVPSGIPYTDQREPDGADPRLDPWLSTEALEAMHHGASLTKVDKALALADWPATYHALRVCWEHPNGLRNCGACMKCVRTMMALELAGSLPRYTTFDLPLTRAAVRGCRYPYPPDRGFARQLVTRARQAGRRALVADLRFSLLRSLSLPRPPDPRAVYRWTRAVLARGEGLLARARRAARR